VSTLCRRTRVTMRVDVRSRLADVDGRTKGYYTVTPIMKEAKYLILCKIIFPLITIIVLCQDLRPDRNSSALPVVRRRPKVGRCFHRHVKHWIK
jgi:hypothetical protein